MGKSWLLYLVFLLPLWAGAQPHSLSFRNIGINEGLSQSSVVDIFTDSSGFVWLATQDGLNRYDGKEFGVIRRNFDDITTPTSSRLGKIIGGSGHWLWLLTSGGKLEKLNLLTESIIPVVRIGKDSTPLPPVNCFLEDSDGTCWIGTEGQGLYTWNPASGELRHYLPEWLSVSGRPGVQLQAIFEDRLKRHWVLTDEGPLIVDGERIIPQHFGNLPGTTPISCSVMEEDRQGNYWLGSYGKGIFLRGKGDSLFRPFHSGQAEGLPGDLVVLTMKVDQEGHVWAGTYGNGLFVIDLLAGITEHFIANKQDPFSLPYNDVLCIDEDKNGGIWIGTDGEGASYYDRRLNNFKMLSKSNVPANISVAQVRAITTDKNGGIWIGTSNSGLTYANLQSTNLLTRHFLPYTKGTSNYDRVVSLLIDEEQDLWVGTQGNGLLILDSRSRDIKKWYHPQSPAGRLPDHTIWCMLPDSGGRVWMGTRNAGLCLFDKEKGVLAIFDTANGSRLPENNIRCLVRISDSVLCIGFEQKGIRFFNTRTGRLLEGGGSVHIPGEAAILLKCIYFQYPYVWIGTLGKGLIAYHLITRQFTRITEQRGLPNNTIYGILPDGKGAVWMSSNKGLFRWQLPADAVSQVDRNSFTSFVAEEGLQGNEFNTGAFHRSAGGRLFFGGINGLSFFDPDKLILINTPARVSITRIMVNNQPLQTDTVVPYLHSLSLDYDRNSLSFNFAALDFVSPGLYHYYYQLLQYDKDWIDAGNRNYAAYTNLPPGRYTFRVKASRQWDARDPGTLLTIMIQPPFWRRPWFIILCTLLFAGILYAFYRYRIRQLLRLQQVRNRIASDLHDDIGSTLTNISMLSELSRKGLPEKEGAHIFLNRISEEVNRSGQALDDIVWSINTNNDSLEQTVIRMRRYAAEIFDAANIHYSLHLDEQFAHRKLNMEQRRDLFLIFKEAIHNVYKHAGAKNVTIHVWPEKHRLFMKIRDDGRGFDPGVLTQRNGLKNIRSRLEKWKGQLVVEAAAGHGCMILIDLVMT